jgi:hypothetical protein
LIFLHSIVDPTLFLFVPRLVVQPLNSIVQLLGGCLPDQPQENKKAKEKESSPLQLHIGLRQAAEMPAPSTIYHDSEERGQPRLQGS